MPQTFNRFHKKGLIYFGSFIALYVIWLLTAIGFRTDHLTFLVVMIGFYFATDKSHKLLFGLIFFIIFWLIFDSMRVLPNYMVNPVHIVEPYNFDLKYFGIMEGGTRITPHQYFLVHNNSFLDFWCGLVYLTWMPFPIAFSVYLFFKDKKTLLYYSAAFLFTNIIGITIYYLYPAAPPWYVELHGFEKNFDIPGSAAGLLKFDEIIGISIFDNIYNKSANVFAAIPSLHSAYPIITLFYALKKRMWKASLLFLLVMVGTWFAAVYTIHHYVIDVLLGIFCAIFALLLFEKLILKSKLREYFDKLSIYIS